MLECFAEKYGCHVVKFQCIINNMGTPMWFSGPHLGTEPDNVLWRHHHPWFIVRKSDGVHEHERLLGDKAYVNSLKILPAVKKPVGRRRDAALSASLRLHGRLSDAEKAHNLLHAHWRIRVEHAYSYFKRFKIIGSRYRGGVYDHPDTVARRRGPRQDHRVNRHRRLHNIVKVILHLCAAQMKRYPLRLVLQDLE